MMNKISREQRLPFQEKETSTLEMLSKSSIQTEVEEFLPANFIVDLTPLVFMLATKKLTYSSLDMMVPVT